MTPQERDRRMQSYLAQARGSVRNGNLLIHGVELFLSMRHAPSQYRKGIVMEEGLIDTLRATVEVLDENGILYAVTGSVASSIHGEPFISLDVDLILQANEIQATAIARRLCPRFYAPEDMLADAARDFSFTNIVDNRTGLKVDFSFIPASGYLNQALHRRIRRAIGTTLPEFWFVTGEDVILMKLLWRRDTRSIKQWENALGVVRVHGSRLDWKYLFDQAKTLEIEEDLVALRDQGGV